MPHSYPVRFLGTGSYLPVERVTSAALDERYGRAAGSTAACSGVEARHYAGPAETSSFMAARALGQALAASGLAGTDLDLIVAASVLPEQPMPTNAVLVQRALGLDGAGIPGFDINASCLGFLLAVEVAALGIAAGRYRRVGIVASEVASKGIDSSDLETSSLFGDGAAAAVLGAASGEPSGSIDALRCATYSRGAYLCQIAAGGSRYNVVTPPPRPQDYLFQMDGRAVFRLAVEKLPRFVSEVLAEAGCTPDEIDLVIPHQASCLGLRYLRERLGFPASKVVDILAERGNQVSASMPSALHEAVSGGRLQRGQRALLLGTAAGLTLGAAVVRF
ncbi:MAG TPA: 3-oxoacyl-[acyl-carrier-protein] synthase III C-terminal domain-containing protein [Thermoanaerobaculia bacterium]|nr:3-oxoacyl-[acyl-carrier-protein] synthase III C-terminal domain-containing protein [Thermoanaerobaculia bacterium]